MNLGSTATEIETIVKAHKDQPFMIMLVGVVCSGKSSLVSELRRHIGFDVLSTDAIITQTSKMWGMTYNEGFKDLISFATRVMNRQAVHNFAKNKDVIWDQTNLTISSRAKKLNMVPKNYLKIAVDLDPNGSYTEIISRLAARNASGEKIIAQDILDNMAKSYEKVTAAEKFDYILNPAII